MHCKKIIYSMLLSFLVVSCNTEQSRKSTESAKLIGHTVYDTLFSNTNTLIRAKLLEDGIATMEWRKGEVVNIGKDTILYDAIEMRDKLLIDKHFARLNLGCGSGCRMSYVMPLDFTSDGKIYLYPLAFDDQQGIIVYQGGGDYLAIIEHIESNTNHILDENFNIKKRPISEAIKEVKLNQDTLYLKWEKNDETETSNYFILSSLGF